MYLRNQLPFIRKYLLYGRLEITNNLAERSIKPFVIDRKNFLFANTPNGALHSAVTFSLIQTAIENKFDPFEYLTYIFKTAPIISQTDNEWTAKMLPSAFKNGLHG